MAAGINTYEYVYQNPIRFLDSTGLECHHIYSIPVNYDYKNDTQWSGWGKWELSDMSSMGMEGKAFWQVTTCVCKRTRKGVENKLLAVKWKKHYECFDVLSCNPFVTRWSYDTFEDTTYIDETKKVSKLDTRIIKKLSMNNTSAHFKCEEACTKLN